MGSIGIGLQLTIFGMGLVFLLLAVMALLLKVLLMTDSAKPEETAVEGPQTPVRAEMDPDTMAAIIVAVTTHRTVRRKEAAPAMRQHWPGTLPNLWVTNGRALGNTSWHPGRRKQ